MVTVLRWPLALPQSLPPESTISTVKNYVETQMDVGPAKRRRRTTARQQLIDVQSDRFILTVEEWAVFDYFYSNSLGDGTLAFMWENPLPSLGDVELRFFGETPKASVIRYGATPIQRRYLYRVGFQLELLS